MKNRYQDRLYSGLLTITFMPSRKSRCNYLYIFVSDQVTFLRPLIQILCVNVCLFDSTFVLWYIVYGLTDKIINFIQRITQFLNHRYLFSPDKRVHFLPYYTEYEREGTVLQIMRILQIIFREKRKRIL